MSARLACPDCGATHDDRWRCDCGAPLSYAALPALPDDPPDPATLDRERGLWAFADALPEPFDARATLGEGFTPEVDAPAFGCRVTLEAVSPTASFKDRGATTTVARALALGVDRLVDDSSGNAAAALATYAARAGIDCEVYVPASVKAGKLRAVEAAGATPVRVEGSRAAVTDACVAAVANGDGWYASHAWRPSFLAGTATWAYEVAARRDWTAPDAVVAPVGHGTLFLGAWRGFRRLRAAGWTGRVPRLYAAQAAGTAPVVAALHGDGAAAGDNDAADGIQIGSPVRHAELLRAVRASGGDALAVDRATTEEALDRLARAGLYVEPTCAVAPAALERLRDRGAVGPDEDVVVPLTGSGLKTD
ncbi:MAG: L-threonine synthase [uncultured archaeon A07HB70]|nr:MAG: L-threonine synthase [uncultured archaeon A07HB70]